jgi:hypothetical protein
MTDMRPLQQQTWETFSVNWQTDVRIDAARAGQPVEEYLRQQAPLVTPEIAGAALVELVRADAATVAPAYRLSGTGLQKLA